MTATDPTEFDHWDDESVMSPWARWTALREAGGLSHSTKHDGFYVASTYADVCAIARDTATYSSHPSTALPLKPVPPFPPMNYDPPESKAYRALVNPWFSPGQVEQYEPWIADLAKEYVGRLVDRDAFDVPLELGIPLTREVILRVLGITDPPAELNAWSDDLVFHESMDAALSIGMFLMGEVEARKTSPGDDLISALVGAPFEDRELTDDEVLRMSMIVLLAGLETTNSAISAAVWYLVDHPEAQEYLRGADDAAWATAMEEIVRWASPAPALARNVTADTEYEGCPLAAGDKVLLLFGSANRDEAEFDRPDDVVLDRYPNRHVGFGVGVHRCLGSHLAKREMTLVLQELLPHLADFELRDPDAVVWTAAEVRGIRSLPLVRRAGGAA